MKVRSGPALSILCAISLLGCSHTALLGPYVPSADECRVKCQEPTLEEALSCAREQKLAYERAQTHYSAWNLTVGTLITALATAAAAVGVSSSNTDAITGLTASAAGIFGIGRWVYRQDRVDSYAKAATSLQCAISAMAPIAAAAPGVPGVPGVPKNGEVGNPTVKKLARRIAELRRMIVDLGGSLTRVRTRVETSAELARAERTIVEARVVLNQAREARSSIETAGARLLAVVEGIRSVTNAEVAKTSPSLDELANNLGQTLSVLPQAITTAAGAIQPLEQDDQAEEADDPVRERRRQRRRERRTAALLHRLTLATNALALDVEETRDVLGDLASAFDDARVESCALDGDERVAVLRTTPRNDLAVARGAQAGSRILVSGGKPQYAAAWIGAVPARGLTLEVMAGVVTVKAAADATPGTYTLLITDSDGYRRTLSVHVTGGKATKERPSGSGVDLSDLVEDVQEQLVALNCLKRRTDEGIDNIDGEYGERTQAAIDHFLEETKATTRIAPTGRRDFQRLLSALASGKRCENPVDFEPEQRRRDSASLVVARLQRSLNQFFEERDGGRPALIPDGQPGENTLTHLDDFLVETCHDPASFSLLAGPPGTALHAETALFLVQREIKRRTQDDPPEPPCDSPVPAARSGQGDATDSDDSDDTSGSLGLPPK